MGVLLCTFTFSHSIAETHRKNQNVLWITIDDQSPWYGVYGDELVKTPNIDAFAKQGVVFERAYAASPVCAPSRSAIITGTYPIKIGAHDMRSGRVPGHQIELPDNVSTLPELFREKGYETFNAGKDDFNFTYSRDDLYSIRDVKAEQSKGPSYKGDIGSGDYTDVSENQSFFGQMSVSGGKQIDKDLMSRLTALGYDPVTPEEVKVPPQYPDIYPVRKQIAEHYNSIMQSDYFLGREVERLKQQGLWENTIIFLFADHGSNLPRSKEYLYIEGLHVPLIVVAPSLTNTVVPGTRRSDIVNLMDIAGTSLGLAGFEVPKFMDSLNFFASGYKRDFVFSSGDRMSNVIDRVRSAMSDDYHYIRNFYTDRPLMNWGYREMMGLSNPELYSSIHLRRLFEAGKLSPVQAAPFEERPAEELYHIKSDPHEIRNLAHSEDHQEALIALRKAVENWILKTDDKGQYPRSEAAMKEIIERFPPSWLRGPEFQQ